MTMLRQIRSTGPMRAPCFRGLSLGHFMLKVYWVLFCCVPGTLAAPCLTCYGFQPGCTFETNGQCPMADIPVANLAITAKAGVGGALILQNAVSNKYNRVINREGLNSLQALMRRPFNGTPVAITKTTTMKTILGWVQSGICVTFRIMGQPRLELGFESRRYISGPSPNVTIHRRHCSSTHPGVTAQ